MASHHVLRSLTRTDKWFLGGEGRLLWAPPFPVFLDAPGFWDKAHYYNFELQPLFTWTLLDAEGHEIPLRYVRRSWTPAVLRQDFKGTSGTLTITVTEEKCILPTDVAVSRITVRGRGHHTLHLVAWTTQESSPEKDSGHLSDLKYQRGALSFTRKLHTNGPFVDCAVAFGLDRVPSSHAVQLSEGSAVLPVWRLTPFYEKFARRKLPDTIALRGTTNDGLVFMGLHTTVAVQQGKSQTLTVALAAAGTSDEARLSLSRATSLPNPVEASRQQWTEFFASLPVFECSDEYLQRYYWYRWYGLRLNTIRSIDGNYNYPFVCEGIGYFRAPISYSATCHMLENRWMPSPDLARGSLLTFLDNQRDDGGFRGYIDVRHYRQEMFYHANWGNSVLQLQHVHSSNEFLAEAYDGLAKYARYFDRERDDEVSGLYDIDNHYETGQEYMHRYIAVNPDADREHWGTVFRLKGIDVTVYIYELKRALAAMARVLGKSDEAELWDIEAETIKAAVLRQMWDPHTEMFFDVDPATGQRTKVKAAVCFYPYFTDIVGASHVPGLKKHLLNSHEFWTPYPVPSSSMDDEFFAAEPEWKGKRMNCPWNGRVWPMTNSHIAEALAVTAIRFHDPALRTKAAEMITRFIRMMHFERAPDRPNCFEHYNPFTGHASVYRGVDDYQHSWVVDLIMKYVCGVRPEAGGVTIDPFPFKLKHVSLRNVVVQGHELSVEILDHRFTVWLDGRLHASSPVGKPVSIPLS